MDLLNHLSIRCNSNLKAGLVKLNISVDKALCVIDEMQRVVGVICDGDIRRYLAAGGSLDAPVSEAMEKRFFYKYESDQVWAYPKGEIEKYRLIPILNADGQMVDYVSSMKPYLSKLSRVPFVIMAGGFGKRLGRLTAKCPKPMLNVGGSPILHSIVEKAVSEGFKEVTISVNYLSNVIKKYFGDGSRFSANITYIDEDRPLGTAGALGLIDIADEDVVVVTNGDVLTSFSYSSMLAMMNSHDVDAVVGTRQFRMANPFGVISLDGSTVVGFDEKPVYRSTINAGIYALRGRVLRCIVANTFWNMTDVLSHALSKNMQIKACGINGDWVDVGSPDDFERANDESHKFLSRDLGN